jgi:hypothetical protein
MWQLGENILMCTRFKCLFFHHQTSLENMVEMGITSSPKKKEKVVSQFCITWSKINKSTIISYQLPSTLKSLSRILGMSLEYIVNCILTSSFVMKCPSPNFLAIYIYIKWLDPSSNPECN